jgi:hypothetical protein
MKDKIVEQVVDKYFERSAVGILKYGTTLEGNNKDNYLNHLQQELMDATLYLEKLMSIHQELTTLVKTYGNDTDLGMAVRKLVK